MAGGKSVMAAAQAGPDYGRTIRGCFIAYIVQAIVNNFAPLLFVTFRRTWGLELTEITLLVTLNFVTQLVTDLLSSFFADRIGIRASMVLAHLTAGLGLICLALLPGLLPDPYVGLVVSIMVCAVGGGLVEVLVSPIVEACPSENKEKEMSLLHSFYNWGQAGAILFSTFFFAVVGIGHWRILAVAFGIFSLANGLTFVKAPLAPFVAEGETGLSLLQLFQNRLFWLFLLMMVCSGASEHAVNQWASTFAEQGLSVSKTVGDLAGPCMFGLLAGVSRLIYGKFGDRLDLDRFMAGSAALCVFSYLLIVLAPHPALSLLGCGLTGFGIGILWPGTFSRASASIRNGGTILFSFLALAGDVGCGLGPTLAGFISGCFSDNLKAGIGAAAVFPALMLVCVLRLMRAEPEKKAESG